MTSRARQSTLSSYTSQKDIHWPPSNKTETQTKDLCDSRKGKARQGIDISFPPSLETREDPSIRRGQVTLTFLNLTQPRRHQRTVKFLNLLYLYDTCACLPSKQSHSVAALPRWERSSNYPATVGELTKSLKTQATNNRSVLAEVQHVQQKMRRQGHLTTLFFVLKIVFRAGLHVLLRKRTQQESSPQCAHPPHRRRTCHPHRLRPRGLSAPSLFFIYSCSDGVNSRDTESGTAVSQRGGVNGSRATSDVSSQGRSNRPVSPHEGLPYLGNRVRRTANMSPIESEGIDEWSKR